MADYEVPQSLQPTQEAVPAAQEATPMVNTAVDDGSAVPMYDHVNKAIIQVPRDSIKTALLTGNYTLPKDYNLDVVSPEGDLGTVPSTTAFKALKSGYDVETAQARAERILQEKYGDQYARTAVEGALRGASLGASDLLQTKVLGVPAEDIAGRQQANPITSNVAEYGTIGASIFTGGAEASLAGKAISAGTKAVSAIGKISEEAVAKQLAKAGASSTIAKAMAEKILPTMVGMGVEGAAYATGSLVSESALGHADFNAENLMATMGSGALLGAVGGTVLHGALAGVSHAAKSAGETIAEKTGSLFDRNKAAAELMGFDTPAKLSKIQEKNPKLFNDLPDFLRNDVGISRGDSGQAIYNKIESTGQQAGKRIGEIADDVQAVMEAAPKGTMPNSKQVFGDLAMQLEDKYIKPYSNTPGYESALRPITDYVDKLNAKVAEGKEFNIKDLMDLRRKTDALIKFEKVPGQFTLKEQMLYDARTMLRDKIDDIASKAGELDPRATNMASQLKNANKLYSYSESVLDNLSKKIDKEKLVSFHDLVLGHVLGSSPAGAILGTAKFIADSDFRRKVVVLSQLEKAQQTVGKAMDKAIKGFFNTGVKVVEPVAMKGIGASAYSLNDTGKKPANRQQAFENVRNNLQQIASAPDNAIERSNKRTAGLYSVAPNTSSALDATAVKAATFLQSKLPKQASQPGILDVIKKSKMPSNYEMAKFERYLDAVEHPLSVFKDLEAGRLTHEHVEALKTVYPTLYSKLVDQVTDVITKQPDAVPYNKRISLSTVLGIPLDESVLPNNVLSLQGNFQSEPEQSQNGSPIVKPSQKGLQSLNIADRIGTGNKEV
jgi:hypothetical protein